MERKEKLEVPALEQMSIWTVSLVIKPATGSCSVSCIEHASGSPQVGKTALEAPIIATDCVNAPQEYQHFR